MVKRRFGTIVKVFRESDSDLLTPDLDSIVVIELSNTADHVFLGSKRRKVRLRR